MAYTVTITNEITSDCEKVLLDDLIKLEREYDFIFPDELKIFYTKYNGGKLKKREVLILSILVDTFISKISLPMQPVPAIDSILAS